MYITLGLSLVLTLILAFSTINLIGTKDQVGTIIWAIIIQISPWFLIHSMTKGVLNIIANEREVLIKWHKKPLLTAYQFPTKFNLSDLERVKFNQHGLLYDMLTISIKGKKSLRLYRITYWPKSKDSFFELLNFLNQSGQIKN